MSERNMHSTHYAQPNFPIIRYFLQDLFKFVPTSNCISSRMLLEQRKQFWASFIIMCCSCTTCTTATVLTELNELRTQMLCGVETSVNIRQIATDDKLCGHAKQGQLARQLRMRLLDADMPGGCNLRDRQQNHYFLWVNFPQKMRAK